MPILAIKYNEMCNVCLWYIIKLLPDTNTIPLSDPVLFSNDYWWLFIVQCNVVMQYTNAMCNDILVNTMCVWPILMSIMQWM